MGPFLSPLSERHTVIAMHGSDRPRKVVQNRTSLSSSVWAIDSTTVQPVGFLKG